jgi:hypothetical protein
VKRPTIAALVVATGLVLLIDLLVVNETLAQLADLVVDAVILVAAGVGLAAAASLALRRGSDLWRRRGDPVAALLVLVGIAVMLVAGLRPGGDGTSDPAVGWLVAALLVPLGATLFGLLFVSTLGAARRSLAQRGREAPLMIGVSILVIVLLLPLGGTLGTWLSETSTWVLDVPIGAVFRGLLLGIAIAAAVVAARTMLGTRTVDD